MEPVYIVSIIVGAIIFVLLICCFYVLAKRRREEEELRAEQDAVYSDAGIAKMEYDIAFYDDDMPGPDGSVTDKQVTIDDVLSGKSAHSAGENAIFAKADDGMEEISGHYEPDEQN